MRYILFHLAKASKVDGTSEIFEFTPAKRDRMICWGFVFFAFASLFIVVGIRVLLGRYD